jgi:DNA-binding XRE family transcriptional regulator
MGEPLGQSGGTGKMSTTLNKTGKKRVQGAACGHSIHEAGHDVLATGFSWPNVFDLAAGIMRAIVQSVPDEDDRCDLMELVPLLLNGSEDEQRDARKAIEEILDPAEISVKRMKLDRKADSQFDEWLAFVSKRIRDARMGAGMTQDQLAKKCDIPQSHLSRLETGQHSPSAKTLAKIAKALGLPASHFDQPE